MAAPRPDPLRRRCLLAAAACVAAPLAAQEAAPARSERLADLLAERRSLWVLRGDEQLRATWWSAAAGYDREQYLKLCWLLRDVQAQRVMPIDRGLLDVLAGIQAWFASQGKLLPMIIHSGYRSQKTNRATEGAARDSQHVLGKAADISLPGVSNLKVAGLASVLGVGGTGFYVGRGFVHVDTGNERMWIDSGARKPKAPL